MLGHSWNEFVLASNFDNLIGGISLSKQNIVQQERECVKYLLSTENANN